MSYGSDLYNELLIESLIHEANIEDEYIRIKSLFESGYWVTKDRMTIKISEMKGSHIRNSIKMIERAIKDEIYSDCESELASIALKMLKQELVKRYPPSDPAFLWE